MIDSPKSVQTFHCQLQASKLKQHSHVCTNGCVVVTGTSVGFSDGGSFRMGKGARLFICARSLSRSDLASTWWTGLEGWVDNGHSYLHHVVLLRAEAWLKL